MLFGGFADGYMVGAGFPIDAQPLTFKELAESGGEQRGVILRGGFGGLRVVCRADSFRVVIGQGHGDGQGGFVVKLRGGLPRFAV